MKCPKCGNEVDREEVFCGQCGTPTSISKVDAPTWINYAYWNDPYNPPPIAPPPPVPKRKRPYTLIIIVLALCMAVASSIAAFSFYKQASTPPLTPTALVTVTVTPTLQASPTPPYASGLNSTNQNIFVNAFSQALVAQDVQSINDATDTLHFTLTCSQSVIITPGGTCDWDWKKTRSELRADKIEFSVPYDATLNQTPVTAVCPGAPLPGNYSVVGKFDNKGFDLPLSHFGNAIFAFVCVSCGSESTWAWQGVYLC